MTTATTIGAVQILGAAFWSTHHASAHDLLVGRERPFTPPSYGLLVGRARRFTSLVTQLHLEVCGSLHGDAAEPPIAVFATRHGEIQTAAKLISDFHEAPVMSSARFALSVHNAASGMYSVAVGSTAPTTTVTGANAIAAGWLEALLTVLETGRTVLLSIADEPVPAVLHGPTELAGVAAGFLLGPVSSSAGGRRAELAIAPCASDPEVDARSESWGGSPPRGIDAGQVLARGVDAWVRAVPATVSLGRMQVGAALELRLASQGTGA